MKAYIYKINYKVGEVKICSTRFGEWAMRQKAREKAYEILGMCLEEEMLSEKLRFVARHLREGFILKNSKNDQNLAKRLFLGEKTKRKGNTINLKPRTKKELDIAFPAKEDFSWGA